SPGGLEEVSHSPLKSKCPGPSRKVCCSEARRTGLAYICRGVHVPPPQRVGESVHITRPARVRSHETVFRPVGHLDDLLSRRQQCTPMPIGSQSESSLVPPA